MKLEIIKGRNGLQEIEVNVDDINGVTSNKQLRLLFLRGNKYRLTLNSHKMLTKELQKQKWSNKVSVY